MSAVTPIATKMVRRGERSDVPIPEVALARKETMQASQNGDCA
jgi:hypothetical protein